MPRSPSNQCYECQHRTSTECSVCHSGFCADHGVILRTFGVLAPSRVYYCAQCYQDFSELQGTQTCYAQDCGFLTNDQCSVCHKPCCAKHCLVEHMPPQNPMDGVAMRSFGGSSQQQDPEQFQKLNKTQICDACASKKYLQRRGGLGGGAALIIIIILIIVLSQK